MSVTVSRRRAPFWVGIDAEGSSFAARLRGAQQQHPLTLLLQPAFPSLHVSHRVHIHLAVCQFQHSRLSQ